MRSKSLMLALLLFGAAAYAEEPKAYQSGELLQMDSVRCGGEKTQELLCQEYQLQTDKVVYRIRAREMKRSVLLPVGERRTIPVRKRKDAVASGRRGRQRARVRCGIDEAA